MMRRSFAISTMLTLVLCGCSTSLSPSSRAPAQGVTATRRDIEYDDPALSSEERQAVRAATEAVLAPNRPRPNLRRVFRYDVSRRDDGWFVIVWHVYGFSKDGNPQFAPGGHTFVQLNAEFEVVFIMGGT